MAEAAAVVGPGPGALLLLRARAIIGAALTGFTVSATMRASPSIDAYLTDFGLAKAAATGSKYTATGEALGTPAYMSPEQARGEVAALGPPTDVWGLGCVLYTLLAGHGPFDGETSAEVVGAVLTREPPRIRRVRPDLPVGLELLLHATLEKSLRWRPRSAGEVRDDLDRILRGERPVVRRRRGPAGAVAATLAAGVLAIAGASYLRGGRAIPPGAVGTPMASEAEARASRARALRTSDPAEGARLLADALRLAPGRHDWRLERGLLLWAVGDGAEALQEWQRIPDRSPDARLARLYEALEPLFDLRGDEARPRLTRVAQVADRAGRLAHGALRVLARDVRGAREALRAESGWEAALLRAMLEGDAPDGDRPLALREYAAGMAEGIAFWWIWNNRGAVRKHLEDLDGAIADYTEALRLRPRLTEAWVNRGTARASTGDLAGAIEDYTRALEVTPSHVATWVQRGSAREMRGDHAGAIADFTRALERDPDLVRARRSRAVVLAGLGDPRRALDDFQRALELTPDDASLWTDRGKVRAATGDLAGAIADHTEAVTRDPRLARAWYNRGNMYFARKDLARALADYDRAVALDPTLAIAWNNRANARRAVGDLAGAIADYGQALACDPADVTAWENRGRARADVQDFTGAIADFSEVLARDPTRMESWVNRGGTREALGDLAGAIADLEQALVVAPADWPHRGSVETRLARARASARTGTAPGSR